MFCFAAAIAGLSIGAHAVTLIGKFDYQAIECKVVLESYEDLLHPDLRLRPACALSLASTRGALAELLPRALPERFNPETLVLFLGRIEEYPWLSERLAHAAFASADWDVHKGRVREDTDTHANRFVGQLLEQDELLRTLVPGWDVYAVSVEKVLVRRVADLTTFRLPEAKPGDKVPVDALLHLRLRPSGKSRQQ